jgi:hypothetical protein
MARESALRAFKHRNYRVLFPASVLSNIGTWAQRIAQDWLVLELTGSAQLLGSFCHHYFSAFTAEFSQIALISAHF